MKVGMFITQLSDVDMAKRSFGITFWTWFLHSGESSDPHKTVEIVNAKSDPVKFSSKERIEGLLYRQQKHSSVVAEDWDMADFLFDRQKLNIVIEDGLSDADHVTFVAEDQTYATTCGDPTLQRSSFTLADVIVASSFVSIMMAALRSC